jgi:hypothetical protein
MERTCEEANTSILRLWAQTKPSREHQDMDEITRFNETIDQAIAEVIRRFGTNATRYSDRFVGILAQDLRSPLNLIQLAAHQFVGCWFAQRKASRQCLANFQRRAAHRSVSE